VKPLVPGQNHLGKRLPRFWKATVSLGKEKGLQRKAERVRDPELEHVCELEVIGLNLHWAQAYVLPSLSILTEAFRNALTPNIARYNTSKIKTTDINIAQKKQFKVLKAAPRSDPEHHSRSSAY